MCEASPRAIERVGTGQVAQLRAAGCEKVFRVKITGTTADRPQRWLAAVAELVALQDDYRIWLQTLPQNLEASATAEALRAICDLDLSDLESVEPPRGFGRD